MDTDRSEMQTIVMRRRAGPFVSCVARLCVAIAPTIGASGCGDGEPRMRDEAPAEATAPVYDATVPKPYEPLDILERWALERGIDLRLVDKLMDERTAAPAFDREPLPQTPPVAPIAADTKLLDDVDPFRDADALGPKEITIRVALARSTFRTRTRAEVLSALQPFIDLVQREVNVRGAPVLMETADELYFSLLDGQAQMAVCHVFDFLLLQSWFANLDDNTLVLLAAAQPANPRTGLIDRDLPGTPGTSIELVVAVDAEAESFADLRGARLALPARYTHAPGAFLTGLLDEVGQPRNQAFFARVTLRRYSKDAVIDVLKGKADVACVDQGTIGALDRFYGLGSRLRTLAVSDRYNVDVLCTSANNIEAHRIEIELTQTQLTTLGKDPEGQEVLFFFDTEGWRNYRRGDIAVPRAHFETFLSFIDDPPVDLRPLLDPDAPVDRRTYDRFGDE